MYEKEERGTKNIQEMETREGEQRKIPRRKRELEAARKGTKRKKKEGGRKIKKNKKERRSVGIQK